MALASLRPATAETLTAKVLARRSEEIHAARQGALSAVDVLFGDEYGEEKKRLARQALEYVLANAPKQTEPATVQTRKKEPPPWVIKLFNSLQLVGFLVLAVAVVYVNWPQPKQSLLVDIPEKPTTPAVITDLADVQWKGNALKLGEPMPRGEALSFDSGTVELLFFNGVRSVIEGPADVILMNERQVFCRQGNWSVTVPPSGIGFEIQTPGATIRDLGTQFYATIDGKNSDVHVLKGAVEVENGKKVLLKTNQAVKVRPGELLDRMTTVADFFVPKTEMRRRSNDDRQRNPPSVAATQLPILSIDFAKENPEGATLYSGAQENGTFQFTDAESRIRLRAMGSLSSFTVLLTVKVDRLKGGFNPILMSEGVKQGGLVWNVTQSGAMGFGVRGQSLRSKGTFETPIVFTRELLGQWVQLGFSVDEKRGRMSIYVNGDPVCSAKLSNNVPVTLNQLDVGNWKHKDNVGQLDGAVERIQVFDRALELHEIRNLQKPEWSATQ